MLSACMPPRSEDGWRSVPELSNEFQRGNCSVPAYLLAVYGAGKRKSALEHGFYQLCTHVPGASHKEPNPCYRVRTTKVLLLKASGL